MIADIAGGASGIHPELYKVYSENLRKAVTGVFGENPSHATEQLQVNVSRFAAYKAWHATQQMQRKLADENGVVRSQDVYQMAAKAVFNAFNRYQAAEYNTAVARARTALQWEEFNSDTTRNEIYPCLKWLPSRSADPREEHMKFYGLVLPKNHPFWNENQPGNLWNCKCDWEESDEKPFEGKLPSAQPARGLEGNPGITGEIFTAEAAYFKATREIRGTVEGDILALKEKAFFTIKTVSGTPISMHPMHNHGEIAGNIEVAGNFLKGRKDVKEIQLLPVVFKDNIRQRADFYPHGKSPHGKYNNADAVIAFNSGEKWVVDFKCMQGNGVKLKERLRDSYEQADYAIIKIKGNPDMDKLSKDADSFLKQHKMFQGVIIYDKEGKIIYNK